MADSAMIAVRGLTKDYGQGRGVFDVDVCVRQGHTLGFLGANGAGKTVTMRTLMGFIAPQRGSARIAGMDCFREQAAIQRMVGYVPGEPCCPDAMTGKGFIRFMARMRGLSDEGRAHELIERFELDPTAKIGRMSKGTKQKVALVCAFMASPSILLLDEPTSGLDPLMQERFLDLVREEHERGATILLSSHSFAEVERACDEVVFIRAGRVRRALPMAQVHEMRQRVYEVTFADVDTARRYCAVHDGASPVVGRADTVRVAVGGEVDAFIKDMATYAVRDVTVRSQGLEDMFLDIYGQDAVGKGHGGDDGFASNARAGEEWR